jgi:hypothetical protein
MHVKLLLWIGVLAVAACVGQPSSPPPTSTSYLTPTGQTPTSVSKADIDEKRLADAKKRGYTLVNTDGETLYCRTDFKTGSHVQKNTTCLTAQELDALHDQTRQGLQSLKPQSPPAGK